MDKPNASRFCFVTMVCIGGQELIIYLISQMCIRLTAGQQLSRRAPAGETRWICSQI